MIPSNLLNVALGAVGSQPVEWSAFTGMTTNAAGVRVATWADPVTVRGSIQPASETLLQQLGLDRTKEYVTFYASQSFTRPDRDMAGDKLTYAGKTYQVQSPTRWFSQAGFEGALAVRIDDE